MNEPIARVRIELREIEPKVFRRVDVPLSSTLQALHEIIQITFDWWGFMEFLEAALDPLHEEHEPMVTWYGKPFDPGDIDERWMRLRLSTLAARRRGALMRHRGTARQRPRD